MGEEKSPICGTFFKEYDLAMNKLVRALDKGFARLSVVLFALTLPLAAQVRGVPASVTSYGFGGHFDPNPGPPASVTSLGPKGFRGGNSNSGRGFCCTSAVPNNPRHHPGSGNHGRGRNGFVGGFGGYYAVPYPVYMSTEPAEPAPAEQFPEEEYRGGPTIFDRRGPGTETFARANASEPEREPEVSDRNERVEPPPAADQPQTLLVFRDGHQVEVQNYAIVGDTLLDLTDGHRRKVAIADLDVEATAKQNDERGIDFRLPVKPQL
jgi:hypothetical protein